MFFDISALLSSRSVRGWANGEGAMAGPKRIQWWGRALEWLAAPKATSLRLIDRRWEGARGAGSGLRFFMFAARALHEDPPSAERKASMLAWLSERGVLSAARIPFDQREGDCVTLLEWEIGADEGLDERHPLVARAFYNVCLGAYLPGASPLEAERCAEQIARRLAGLSSVAPSEEWFEGFFESDDALWRPFRELAFPRLKALLEAREIEASAASGGASDPLRKRAGAL